MQPYFPNILNLSKASFCGVNSPSWHKWILHMLRWPPSLIFVAVARIHLYKHAFLLICREFTSGFLTVVFLVRQWSYCKMIQWNNKQAGSCLLVSTSVVLHRAFDRHEHLYKLFSCQLDPFEQRQVTYFGYGFSHTFKSSSSWTELKQLLSALNARSVFVYNKTLVETHNLYRFLCISTQIKSTGLTCNFWTRFVLKCSKFVPWNSVLKILFSWAIKLYVCLDFLSCNDQYRSKKMNFLGSKNNVIQNIHTVRTYDTALI